MPKKVDSYKWLHRSLAGYYKGIDVPRRDRIPWTELNRSLPEATVCVVTTAGLHLRDDRPFDRERERREPTWGDPSVRILPRDVSTGDVEVSHLHYDPAAVLEDLDVLFPVPLLRRLTEEGVIGGVAERHYSFMGFQLDATELLKGYLPETLEKMREDAVDAVILTPA